MINRCSIVTFILRKNTAAKHPLLTGLCLDIYIFYKNILNFLESRQRCLADVYENAYKIR